MTTSLATEASELSVEATFSSTFLTRRCQVEFTLGEFGLRVEVLNYLPGSPAEMLVHRWEVKSWKGRWYSPQRLGPMASRQPFPRAAVEQELGNGVLTSLDPLQQVLVASELDLRSASLLEELDRVFEPFKGRSERDQATKLEIRTWQSGIRGACKRASGAVEL